MVFPNFLRPVSGAFLLCAVTIAQAAPPPLSLAEALRRVEAHNPQLAARAALREAAGTRLPAARLKPNPELKVAVEDVLGSGDYRAVDSSQLTVSLAQLIEPRARVEGRVAVAQAGIGIEAAALDAERWALLAETHRRYAVALVRAGRLALAGEALANAQRLHAATDARVRAAAAPLAERERAFAVLARAELDVEDQEHELAAARVSLAALWQGEDDFGALAGDVFALPPMRPLADWQAALSASPALRRFTAERALIRAEQRLLAAERQRSWQLEAGLRHYGRGQDFGLVGGVSLPLRRSDPQMPRLAEAEARLRAAESGEAAAVAEARAELFSLYQEMNHGQLHLKRLREEVLPANERALTATEAAVQRGRYGVWEWLQVRNDWLATKKEMLDDAELLHTTLAALERVSGLALIDGIEHSIESNGAAP